MNDPLPAAEWHAINCEAIAKTLHEKGDEVGAAVMYGCAGCIRATVQLCRDLQAENQRFRREILAAGTMQDFDWSVLVRLDALDGIKAEAFTALADAGVKVDDSMAADVLVAMLTDKFRDQAARIAELEAEVARLRNDYDAAIFTVTTECQYKVDVAREVRDAAESKAKEAVQAEMATLRAENSRLLGEPTHPVPITEAFQRLAEASGDHWDGFDPQAYVRGLRDGNTKGGE